jgi:hypothetical protein
MEDGTTGTDTDAGIGTLVQSLQNQIAYLSSRLQDQPSLVFAPCLSKTAPSGWSWRGLISNDTSCTTRSTKGFEIEFRALLTDGAQEEEVRFERVAVG